MAKVKARVVPVVPNILQDADTIINGDREQTYGDASKNLRNIAAYWSIHLNATYGQNLSLTPADVCGMMILLKQARLANTPQHRDSLVDICGYAALLDKVNQQDELKTSLSSTVGASAVSFKE